MNALEAIKQYKLGTPGILKAAKWLKYIVMTKERNVNIERVESVSDYKDNMVLRYVERTLEVLDTCELNNHCFAIVEEVLKWSEVAKCGTGYHREKWQRRGVNLYAHNEGSAKIYLDEPSNSLHSSRSLIFALIKTHGLIGQHIRGEVNLADNMILHQFVKQGHTNRAAMYNILCALNKCVIGGVSTQLWESLEENVVRLINQILDGNFGDDHPFEQKLSLLRSTSIKNGEDLDKELNNLTDIRTAEKIKEIFATCSLWYVESALYDFSFTEFMKIFALVHASNEWQKAKHLSFEKFMKHIYYDYKGYKRVNIYKKRIIENYLGSLSFADVAGGKSLNNPHVRHTVACDSRLSDTVFFDFEFSAAGSKLIEFCVEAEKSGLEYEKAPIMLFDIFGLRKDKYDRFNNEDNYLKDMNSSIDYKKVILDYIAGDTVVDIGPGGGVMLDLIEDHMPDVHPIGLDISSNVVDALNKRKFKEGKKWEVIQGDALDLKTYFPNKEATTFVYSSIIHEIFSYVEYEGRKFNHNLVRKALKSAFEALPMGGRVIIRDGIMTEPKETLRRIKFHSNEGLEYLKQYKNDFKGREISFKITGHNEVEMPINDAMEFLYTYTWGPEAYAHEVQEQFGYFTPSEYEACIKETLGESAKILESKYYLQDGYSEALLPKISFYDVKGNVVPLPNSTCLIVIEKV